MSSSSKAGLINRRTLLGSTLAGINLAALGSSTTARAELGKKPSKLVVLGDNASWKGTILQDAIPAFKNDTGIDVEYVQLPIDALVGFAGWCTPTAAPGHKEACRRAGSCHAVVIRQCGGRYRRTQLATQSEPLPNQRQIQAGSLRRRLPRPGRRLHVPGRCREPARHGAAARRRSARRPPALHRILHER